MRLIPMRLNMKRRPVITFLFLGVQTREVQRCHRDVSRPFVVAGASTYGVRPGPQGAKRSPNHRPGTIWTAAWAASWDGQRMPNPETLDLPMRDDPKCLDSTLRHTRARSAILDDWAASSRVSTRYGVRANKAACQLIEQQADR